ncbi:MAG: hypothetical protein AAGH89_02600 [Verrucomicrobiota bacterium]
MWELQTSRIDDRTLGGKWKCGSKVLSYREVIDLWRTDAEFRRLFANGIADCPFKAVFWETPPVTLTSLQRPFEYVLVEGKPLERLQPDPEPFGLQFSASSGKPVLTFPNLGGDAILIVPAPLVALSNYTHLAAFLRGGSPDQVDLFWQAAGEAMEKQISDRPTWLSTAGLGVSWLHLRLDSRPKYYRHMPYKVLD